MPQQSLPYAAARVCVKSGKTLDSTHIERLLAAHTLSDAINLLDEFGWTSTDNTDYGYLSGNHLRDALSLVKSLSPNPEMTDGFMLQYDIMNLKILLKSRSMGETCEALSECGLIPTGILSHAVNGRNYVKLPSILRNAMDSLERKMAVSVDPLEIDTTLDKVYYTFVLKALQKTKKNHCALIRSYYLAKADLTNAITLMRAKKLELTAFFFQSVLLPFGTISADVWAKAFKEPGRLPLMLAPYGRGLCETLKCAQNSLEAIPLAEKAMDDYLYHLFRSFRHSPLRIEALICYLLLCQREAAMVRLILTGKVNGFTSDAIRERMRIPYV
jgi:vacuolar-type H+-ATPase subunit C/Vma6